MIFPHGATVDRDGNLWVTDARGGDGKGHQVFKFSPDGKVLMTLGKAGVSGSGPTLFDQPTDVVVAPNGDIFVTDSHRSGKNNRVVKFTQDGKFIKEWGTKGTGRGELSEPHTIAIDSRGRLFVGDRENNRIQIFDQDGTVPRRVAPVRPAERHLHHARRHDLRRRLRVAAPTPARASCPASRRGFASAAPATARVTAFIEDMESTAAEHAGAEGVGVDAAGNVYGGVVRRQMLERHVLAPKK